MRRMRFRRISPSVTSRIFREMIVKRQSCGRNVIVRTNCIIKDDFISSNPIFTAFSYVLLEHAFAIFARYRIQQNVTFNGAQ